MNKKYRHKPTGWIYELRGVTLHSDHNGCIPGSIATMGENHDWEEIESKEKSIMYLVDENLREVSNLKSKYQSKPEPVIPSGIVTFKTPNIGIIWEYADSATMVYDEWVSAHFYHKDDIHTIKVDGVEFSVGDETDIGKINSIQWNTSGGWAAYIGDFNIYCMLSGVKKIPERKPIVTLQGKEMFEGDKYYGLDKDRWVITEMIMKDTHYWDTFRKTCSRWPDNYFPTKELAEQYIRDNKPVYPKGVVEPLLQSWLDGDKRGIDRWMQKLYNSKTKSI